MIRQEAIEEYSKELGIKEDEQKERLKKIIKKEKRTGFMIVETAVSLLLLAFVIFAQISGIYSRDNITIDCVGDLVEVNGVPYQNLSLEEYYEQTGKETRWEVTRQNEVG